MKVIIVENENMKKIVCFGGGNALPKAVLPGLRKHDVEITSITSMVDSGGSTGQLRKDFNVLPPGDIRRHLLALSDAPDWKKKLFAFKFGHEVFDGGHKGHTFANIFLVGLEHITKDYEKVLDITHDFLEVKKHKALPATLDKTHVFAELENGEIIEGEDEIDVPKKHDANMKIKNIFLKPHAKAYQKAVEAIKHADMILIGPGDMHSSLMPCFLPEGMKEAMQNTKAKKVFVCPSMTKLGETNDFTVHDFAAETEKYIGCPLNHVLFNTNIPSAEKISEYRKAEPSVHKIVAFNGILDKNKFIGADLLAQGNEVVYDSDKVAGTVMNLLK